MVENTQGMIQWAQSLPPISKTVITAALVLFCGFILLVLWQKSAEVAANKQPPGTNNQIGGVVSSGQLGGITAGQYINYQAPPITSQQREQALLSLRSEIEELADFPNRPDLAEPRTLLEQITIFKASHQLFVILNRYYKQTITDVPISGADLLEYKKEYSKYENDEYALEQSVPVEIGKIVAVEFNQAWKIYFKYFLYRFAGLTQQQIIEGGNFLNYGITWAEAERVFNELKEIPSVGPAMAEQLSSQKRIIAKALSLLDSSKRS
ncbi:MAG: hypothetical protein JWO51_3131 [Rhodospirillales bacterium]|nr:hypothetical protein [Rhodospirillales bacterium]